MPEVATKTEPEVQASPWKDKAGRPITKGAIVEHPGSKLVGEADYRWTKNVGPTGKSQGKAIGAKARIKMIGVIPTSSDSAATLAAALGRTAKHISIAAEELVVKAAPKAKE